MDGLAVVYKMLLPMFRRLREPRGILNVTWEGGQQNNVKYGNECIGYVCDVSNKIERGRLEIVGKVNWDNSNLYSYKDINDSDFKDFYEHRYWTKGGEKKKL